MKQSSDAIEFAIEFAWANGCDLTVINKAKESLRKLKNEDSELHRIESSSDDPVSSLINSCEKAINTGYWSFDKNQLYEAKVGLSRLKAMKKELAKEAYNANQFATEEMNLYLETAKELGDLQKKLVIPVAWAKINNRGDLYDLRLQNNPYDNQEKIIPLYRKQ